MKKHLSKYGNSLALIIDKPILKLLNIKEDTELKITTDGITILITPIFKNDRSDALQRNLKEVMLEYEPALKKLAKN